MYSIDRNNRAISIVDGTYIGTIEFAEGLKARGITAQGRRGQSQVASIGFCENEQKWYGWSHRAICGFGLGSSVKRGDCAYVPVDWDDMITTAIEFWNDPSHTKISGIRTKDEAGIECVRVEWFYSNDPNVVPNKSIWLKPGQALMYPPDIWGRGEWTADTLDDARLMAEDYAEGVG